MAVPIPIAMTQIDFYVVKDARRGDRFDFTCRLVERVRKDRLRVLINCPDQRQARHLDRLLWTYREESFLPHGLVGETDPVLTPVLISADGQPDSEDQVLINLDTRPEVPPFFSRFQRLCELLDQDAAALEAGRTRFAYYRDCGYPLRHHQV